MKNNNKICQDALESLQELKLEEVDELLGGAGHGVILFQQNVVGIVYKQSFHVANF